MHWKHRGWTLIGMLMLALPAAMSVMRVAAAAQSAAGSTIATTQVTDTVYLADGTPASGTVIVSVGGVYDGDRAVGAERDDVGDDYEWGR